MGDSEQSRTAVKKRLASPWAAVLLMALAAVFAGYLFVNSVYFKVGVVRVEGNKYISEEDIYHIADIPGTMNIFRLNTADIKKRLTNDLRVASAEVTREFPSTIVIKIEERKPLAYIAGGYGFFELDKQGVILSVFKNLRELRVPMITGLKLGNSLVGDKTEDAGTKKVLEYLAALDEKTLNELSEVSIKAPDQIVVYTVKSLQIRLGSTERLAEKAQLTQKILSEVTEKNLAIDYIDLNYTSPIIKIKQ
jgi:cell division protein FtsQ